MAVIKLNASGQVILRGGLPSCTCCGTTLYVEHLKYYLIHPSSVVTRFEMTGTVGAGFTGAGPGGTFTLAYDIGAAKWFMTDPVFGISASFIGGSADPAAPAGTYYDADVTIYPDYAATVSLTPLP